MLRKLLIFFIVLTIIFFHNDFYSTQQDNTATSAFEVEKLPVEIICQVFDFHINGLLLKSEFPISMKEFTASYKKLLNLRLLNKNIKNIIDEIFKPIQLKDSFEKFLLECIECSKMPDNKSLDKEYKLCLAAAYGSVRYFKNYFEECNMYGREVQLEQPLLIAIKRNPSLAKFIINKLDQQSFSQIDQDKFELLLEETNSNPELSQVLLDKKDRVMKNFIIFFVLSTLFKIFYPIFLVKYYPPVFLEGGDSSNIEVLSHLMYPVLFTAFSPNLNHYTNDDLKAVYTLGCIYHSLICVLNYNNLI